MLEDAKHGKHVRRCFTSTQSTKLAGGKDLELSCKHKLHEEVCSENCDLMRGKIIENTWEDRGGMRH